MNHLCCFFLGFLISGSFSLDAQIINSGYRIEGKTIITDRVEEWIEWDSPPGVIKIKPGGSLTPRFIRANSDAVRNASSFFRIEAEGDTIFGGLYDSGSNKLTAVNSIDGDLNTYWEPYAGDSIEKWFLEIDLGRSVIAKRINVHFVPEGKGDPFLKFRVMISDGRKSFGGSRRREYFRVGQVNYRNKTDRAFSFDVMPLRPTEDGLEGAITQFVRIDVLETDGGRGQEISEEQYNELPETDRGTVDYFRVTVSGREILVSPTTHRQLPEVERGPIRYYRYERPRLSEIEVIEVGDNVVALTQRELFQDQTLFSNLLRRQLTDGFHTSSFDLRSFDPIRNENQLEIDLGAKYWIDRIRLLSPFNPPIAYQLRISNGVLDASGALVWKELDERSNSDSHVQLEERFTRQEVRYIELRRLAFVGSSSEKATLSEVQAFGEGYVSDVRMTSPVIKLNRSGIFSQVRWDASIPPSTSVEVRSRSGDDLIEEVRYFDRYGREISEDRWKNIRNKEHRGPVVINELIGPRWSNWSEVYESGQNQFKSPNPRRMIQLQVRLRSSDPYRATEIRSIEVEFDRPLVGQLSAEIWPVRGVSFDEEKEFTISVLPKFNSTDPGFDRIKLRSSATAELSLISVESGSETALRIGNGRKHWPGEWIVLENNSDSIDIALPEVIRSDSNVFEFTFRTKIYTNSTTFFVEFLNSEKPGVTQIATEGDVVSALNSQSMVVVADMENSPILSDFRLYPKVITPNGDTINDVANLTFSVFRVQGAVAFDVFIVDLAGQKQRDLSFFSKNASGTHSVRWDGLDDRGILVNPGIYLVRIEFPVDVYGRTGVTLPISVIF